MNPKLAACMERMEGMSTAYIESDYSQKLIDGLAALGAPADLIQGILCLSYQRGYLAGHRDGCDQVARQYAVALAARLAGGGE